jgi:hypothetical protein
VVLRLYGEDEAVGGRDLRSIRRFLDMRGILDANEFDVFVERATTPG